MAFSDFKTIPEVQQTFGIAHTRQDFLTVESSEPSEHFLRDFEFKQQHIDVLASEGARCEAIIFPILLDVYKDYAEACALWIKKAITYNETLSGTPDYFVSRHCREDRGGRETHRAVSYRDAGVRRVTLGWIEDSTRQVQGQKQATGMVRYTSHRSQLESAISATVHHGLWEGQANRVLIWIEKEGLSSLFQRAIDDICPRGIEFLAGKGQASVTIKNDVARSIAWDIRDGFAVQIYYFGDFDFDCRRS